MPRLRSCLHVALLFSLLSILSGLSFRSYAAQAPEHWGIAYTLRDAFIPYQLPFDTDDQVYDLAPLLFYQQGPVNVEGQEAALRYAMGPNLTFGAVGRYRFFDIPEQFDEQARGNAVDLGLQLRWLPNEKMAVEFEALQADSDKRFYQSRLRFDTAGKRGTLSLDATARFKSLEFNNHFYGLDLEQPGEGIDLSFGMRSRLQLIGNANLYGQLRVTRLEGALLDYATVSEQYYAEVFAGVAIFNQDGDAGQPLDTKPYLRLSWGLGSRSSLSELLTFKFEHDEFENQLGSLFYGQPVADDVFNLPIEVYFTPGVAWHLPSEVQSSSPEVILAYKGYYTAPIGLRFGVAEGISYLQNITYIEQQSMDENDSRSSQLLNYLDFSLDFSLGRVLRQPSLRELWFGYAIHHRSGIFSTSSAFGRVNGGSNYQTLYLQWHY